MRWLPLSVTPSALSGSPPDTVSYLAWHHRSVKNGIASWSFPIPQIDALLLDEALAHVRVFEVYVADVAIRLRVGSAISSRP